MFDDIINKDSHKIKTLSLSTNGFEYFWVELDGKFYNIGRTRENNTVKYYVNGELKAEKHLKGE